MADAVVTARLVPAVRARDLGDPAGLATPGALAQIAAVVDAVSGVDAVEIVGGSIDGGTTPGDGTVSLLVSVTDASVATAQTVIDTVLALTTADVFDDGGTDLVLAYAPGAEDIIVADPTIAVTSPSVPAIAEEGTDRVVIVVDPVLFGSNRVATYTVTTTELSAADIPVAIRGLPNGHESQKVTYPTGRLIFKVGPAPVSSAGEYDIVVDFLDGNGRGPASPLTFQVYVSDETAPVLDSDDADDSLTLDDAAATDTTVLSGVSQTPLVWELVSALDQATGLVDISAIVTLDDQADFNILDGSSTCELIINPEDEVTPADTYDIIVRATDGLGLSDTYTLELVLTDT